MGTLVRIGVATPWGAAEQAALERCLSIPVLSEPHPHARRPRGLSRMIEAEIIPRLMLAHQPRSDGDADEDGAGISAADVLDFTRLALEREAAHLLAHVAQVEARGLSVEAILLDLLTPTARLLGDMWRDDLCSFADVTIAMSRLQQVLRELGFRFDHATREQEAGRVLLAAVPGEQHVFGVLMLESFFRRAGWEVGEGGGAATRAELIAAVRHEHVDLIGLSLSSDVLVDGVAPLIRAVRKASLNPSLVVMVGGRYFLDHPDRAGDVGADMAAGDAPDALRLAGIHVRPRPALC